MRNCVSWAPAGSAKNTNLEFIDPDTAAFPTDIISRCFTALVKPLWG